MKPTLLVIAATAMATISFAPRQDEAKGRKVQSRDGKSDGVQFEASSADLNALVGPLTESLSVKSGDVEMKVVGPGSFEIWLKRAITDEEFKRIEGIVKAHVNARKAAGQTGIVALEMLSTRTVPEAWKKRYDAAGTDSDRLNVMAEYLGFREPAKED